MVTAPASGRTTRLMALLNRPVILLATGIGLSAAAGSGFLAVVNHSMDPSLVAPLPGLYFLLAAIGTGMFAAFELEMTRTVSRALALGHDTAQIIRHQIRNAAWVGVGTVAVVCAAGPYMTHRWLYGDWVVFAEVLAGLVSIWAAFLVRGVLSGRQQFRSYAITMVVDGLAKLIPSILLSVSGLGTTWSYGLVFALGPAAAALSGLFVARAPIATAAPEGAPAATGEPETANQAAVRLARLTGGILAGQVLMYSVPLVVTGRLTGDKTLAVTVGSAVGLTRLALLILFPLQAPMLPKLTAAAAHGRMGVVRRTTAVLVAVVVAASLAAIAGTGLFGQWVLRDVMGTHGYLSAGFLMELTTGTLFLMVANILQSTLTALNRQQTVLWSWTLGVVAMIAVFAVPLGPLTTAAVASIAGPAVTSVLMAADVVRVTGRPQPAQGQEEQEDEQGPDGISPARPQDRSVRRSVSSR